MSGLDKYPPPRGGRALMVGTFVLAAAAAAVLALGAADVRLLRLGLIAALWAALLGAFAAARMRREIGSAADRVDELRAAHQLELEREVAARREHTLTVELKLREQAEQAERREIEALRAELGALRMSLEHLRGGDALMERVALGAEPARLVPLPTSQNLPEPFRFGPASAQHVVTAGISNAQGNGRQGASSRESSGSNGNGAYRDSLHSSNGFPSNGLHSTGGGPQWVPEQAPPMGTQRSVGDLLAAYGAGPYGAGPVPRRRRSRDDS